MTAARIGNATVTEAGATAPTDPADGLLALDARGNAAITVASDAGVVVTPAEVACLINSVRASGDLAGETVEVEVSTLYNPPVGDPGVSAGTATIVIG